MTKRRKWQELDAEAESQAKTYKNPIPSRAYILALLEERGVPVPFDELVDALELDRRESKALSSRLRAMVRDGQVLRNRRDGYCLVDRLPVVTGTVSAHRDGFGFVIPDREETDDVFLSPRSMRELMHGDRVAVRVKGRDRRGRPEGAVIEVLERATTTVVGRYVRQRRVGFVVPENPRITHRIVIPREAAGKARRGQVVLAEITSPPTRETDPIGKIVKVLGKHDAPGIEVDIAIHAHGLPTEWSKAVGRETRRLGDAVPARAARGRKDLRDLPLVTIDGADARDFDDAVYCEETRSGWRLYVAIADVSHYVTPDSALDREAEDRGTSVYFTRRVVPMLPEALSNGLCSLKEGVDRLCMVCEMQIARDGTVSRSRFFEGIMHSHARLTYDEVAAMLFSKDRKLRRRHADLLPDLERLHAVFEALLRQRRKRGAIDFELPEAFVELGEDLRIESISTYERNDAHRMIEECMIAANVAAARFLSRKKLPTLYRVHDEPSDEKLTDLKAFLATLGVRFPKVKDVQPRHFSRVLAQVRGKPHADLVETILLRSMSRAAYQPDNLGHFGLALEEYAHFTSPIRRYPDLLVHRAIKHALRGRKPASFEYTRKDMERLGEHCSMTGARADQATREAVDWLKCDFMLDKIGDEFDGVITGVTHFGVFVQLEDVFVEGLIHVTALDNDYYDFDATRHRLVGSRTKKIYQLAAPQRVRLVAVDMEQRRIDFEPVAPPARMRRRRPSAKRAAEKHRSNAQRPTASPGSGARKSRRRRTRP